MYLFPLDQSVKITFQLFKRTQLLLYVTQRWSHHSAEGNKSSIITTTMKSSTLGYFCPASALCMHNSPRLSLSPPCYMEQGVLVWGWWKLCVQSSACSDTESARMRGNNRRMSNTQLDSLLYPGDERSATWALPCCDLAPFGDSESCTHVHISHNNTTEALQTACPIHTHSIQPSTQFTFVSHWQMAFRVSGRLTYSRRHMFGNGRPGFHPAIWAAYRQSWGFISPKGSVPR